jgi:hypothetical protein
MMERERTEALADAGNVGGKEDPMRRHRWAASVLGLGLIVIACWARPAAAGVGPVATVLVPEADAAAPQQIPDLLRAIVEGVEEALEELVDSVRKQLCGRCPAAAGTMIGIIALAAGCERHYGP